MIQHLEEKHMSRILCFAASLFIANPLGKVVKLMSDEGVALTLEDGSSVTLRIKVQIHE
jgi:hypothetical protein